jgi:hypothetical protein
VEEDIQGWGLRRVLLRHVDGMAGIRRIVGLLGRRVRIRAIAHESIYLVE